MQQSAKQELALLPGGLHFSLRIPHFMFSPTPAYYPGFGIFVRLFNFHIFLFVVFRHASVSFTYPGPGQSVVCIKSHVRTSILAASLSPHKASRQYCGG